MNMHALQLQDLSSYMDMGIVISLPPLSLSFSGYVNMPACKSRASITGEEWLDFYSICKHVEDVGVEWMHLLSYIFSVWFLCNSGISL